MKRFRIVSFIIGLLVAPMQAQAQQPLPGVPEGSRILHYGPPVLTQQAADCALLLIKLQAAVVNGFDVIDITPEVRQIWSNYLANNYASLVPFYQQQFGPLACPTLATLNATLPQMLPLVRESYRQQWATSLPAVLQFLDPVLVAAVQLRAYQQQQLRAAQQTAPPAVQNPDPVATLRRQQEIANSLANHNSMMNNIYVPNLMRAMSGH